MELKIWRSPYPQNQKPMFHLKQLILLCNGMPPPESKVRMNYNKIPRYLSIRGLHCQIRITGETMNRTKAGIPKEKCPNTQVQWHNLLNKNLYFLVFICKNSAFLGK